MTILSNKVAVVTGASTGIGHAALRGQTMSDYDRIASAMAYLVDHATAQPSLEEVAAHVHLSPYHFQRLFCRWAGTTPKRFYRP